MNKIIGRLWRGTLDPNGISGIDSEEMDQMSKQLENLEVQLEARLSAEDKDMFQQYYKIADELSAMMQEQAFCDGYYLGTRIMIETIKATKE